MEGADVSPLCCVMVWCNWCCYYSSAAIVCAIMHSTYVRMALDRQRAEARNRKHRRRSAMAFKNKLKDCCRKLTAFFFTQVRDCISVVLSRQEAFILSRFETIESQIRLESAVSLWVTQSSALSCSSPWKRMPNCQWHQRLSLAVGLASTTCGTVIFI